MTITTLANAECAERTQPRGRERLAKVGPAACRTVTPGKKGRLAESDRVYKGKLAEREIVLTKQLDEAYAARKADEDEKVQKQLVSERARLDEDREEEKERVRRAK